MALEDRDIVLLSGARTPFGVFMGSLKDISAIDLTTTAAKAAIERAGVAATDIDQVVFGNVLQTSKDAIYFARHVALKAGVLFRSEDRDIVLLSGARTPFGVFMGSLKDISAIDLTTTAAKAAIERAGVAATDIDQVVFGNVLQTSKDAIYFARHVALKAGVPI